MTTERTLAIIKPDAVRTSKSGQILARIEQAGFTVKAMRLGHLSKRDAEGFYAVHRARPFGLLHWISTSHRVVVDAVFFRQRTGRLK